jgi:hypothetical protein
MAWAHVANDKTALVNVTASSFVVSWTNNTVAGNRAFIIVSHEHTGAVPVISSITDPRGNTWNPDLVKTFTDGVFNAAIEIWSAQIVTQILSSDSLTVNFSSVFDSYAWATSEYSGLDTSTTPVDVSISANSGGTASTAPASGSTAATNAANEMVLRVYGDDGFSDTFSAPPAGTNRASQMSNSSDELWTSDQDSGSSGATPSASGTLTPTAANWAIATIVYKLAGVVATGTFLQQRILRLRGRPFQRVTASGTTFDPTINQRPEFNWGWKKGSRLRIQQKISSPPTGTIANVLSLVGAVLTFTGPTNLKNATTKGLTGATLSFTGVVNLKNAITKLLVAATLTFTGPVNLVKATGKLMTGVLSFTGPANLVKAIIKLMTAVLSFTGAANLKNVITKGLAAGVLSFTGAITKLTSKFLAAAVLSFNGVLATTKQFNRALTAVLSFTGPTNLTNAIQKRMTGVLSFTGPSNLLNVITKGLAAAILSFTGAITKFTNYHLTAAVLSFVGNLASGKFVHQLLTAVLNFTGVFGPTSTGKNITAALSFTGSTNLLNRVTKTMTATLPFVGAFVKQTQKTLTIAALSFTGAALTKQIQTLLTGALSFVGNLATNLISGGSHFFQTLTGTLSFTGAITKQPNKILTAVLSFNGASLKNAITKTMTGSLSFNGLVNNRITKTLAAATLSFTGAITKQWQKIFTATLSFTGVSQLGHSITKLFTAALSFTGSAKLLNAITKRMTGVLSFTGAIGRRFPIQQLTATLTFNGAFVKQAQKRFTATLTFTGITQLPKAIKKLLTGVLTFGGTLLNPGNSGVAKRNILHDTIPLWIDIAQTETFPWAVDVTNYLSGTDTIGAKFATLLKLPTGAVITTQWHNPYTVVGNVITIPIIGSALDLGHTYQLTLTFVANTNKTVTYLTYLTVVA